MQEGQADNDRWWRLPETAIPDGPQKLQIAQASGLDFSDDQIDRVITREPERCDAVLGLDAHKLAFTRSAHHLTSPGAVGADNKGAQQLH